MDSSEYVIQFLLRLDLFQMKNMTSIERTSVMENSHIVAFSSRRPNATKHSPFKALHYTQNFSSFYLKMCKLIIKILFS